jgi:hypothetical protein
MRPSAFVFWSAAIHRRVLRVGLFGCFPKSGDESPQPNRGDSNSCQPVGPLVPRHRIRKNLGVDDLCIAAPAMDRNRLLIRTVAPIY